MPTFDSWLRGAIPVDEPPEAEKRVSSAISLAHELANEDPELNRGHILAAFFDLLVAQEYYLRATAAQWIYCPLTGRIYWSYTNACPGCIKNDFFYYTAGNKPPSGTVGKIVSGTLRTFIKCHLDHLGKNILVLQAREPMDLIIYSPNEKRVFAGEIKAAPLMTLPLEIDPTEVGLRRSSNHSHVDLREISKATISFPSPVGLPDYSIPVFSSTESVWEQLSSDRDAAKAYISYWNRALAEYGKKRSDHVRWLSNSCGAPPAGTPSWPAKATSLQSISDGKSSVGMDRTDDIKKAVYQLIRIRLDIESEDPDLKVHTGIVSNIHPVRHGKEYIYPLLNIVWRNTSPECKDPYEEHNLIDGLVALSEQRIVNPWVKEVFSL